MKPRARLVLIFVALLLLTFLADQWRRARVEHSQDKNILAASRKYGVDAALIKAVVWKESRFHPEARGRKGEIGLMQIMPRTGQEWADATRLSNFSEFVLADPVQNIDAGAWYLSRVMRRYTNTDNPTPYALADYNAGRGNVLKWMKGSATTNSADFVRQIGFPSTRDYVRSIMKRREKYATWAAAEPTK
jgi:soluble lytic murein transglycosylase